MTNTEKITLEEFHARLKAQGVPPEHFAFKCVICGTIQSMVTLMQAGVPASEVENYIGFSCVGRWTNAGPHRKGESPGRGCDWTLGGLLGFAELVVIADGKEHRRFAVATPEEAKALMTSERRQLATAGSEKGGK